MLEGPNIILRLFKEDDLDEFFTLRGTYAERGDFEDSGPVPEAERRKQFSENGWWSDDLGRMAVTNKDGRLLGVIVFFKGLPFEAGYEVGFVVLRREDRCQGIVSEALRIFSAYLFDLKPVPRLQLRTSVDNLAARRVAEKCGYRLEGVQRQVSFARGEYRDCAQYSLLRDECPPLAEVLQAQQSAAKVQ